MGNKRGRPVKMDAKRDGVHFRLGEKEKSMLTELSEKTGKSRTDLFVGMLEREHKKVMRRKG